MDGAFLDCQKAFNTVHHKRLMMKLDKYVSGRWRARYIDGHLSNRAGTERMSARSFQAWYG